ncbi:MAG: hypothetical protein HY746_04445 [Elusimicrobia bacterium]|nr:hypothetical protein [Elusimicrobiota bacterium]
MENKWDKEFEAIWKRTSVYGATGAGSEYARENLHLPDDVRESNMDTIRFLKDNYLKAQAELEKILEAKDKTIQELNFQIEETRAHFEELRGRYQAVREKLIAQDLDTSLRLEESRKIVKEQKQAHVKETRLLQEVLERTKIEMKNLKTRIDELILERDEISGKLTQMSVEKSDLSDAVKILENKQSQAKEAVEKTLSELLSERRNKSEADKKIRELEKDVKDLQDRIQANQENWEAERRQWRELWDRERSVWETHRQEFAVWEERLRAERLALSDKMKQEEIKTVEYASGLTKLLKESSEWSEKVTQILKLYALKGVELPKVFVSAPKGEVRSIAGKTVLRIFAVTLAGILFMAGLSLWIIDYRSRVHFSLLSRHPVELENPTSIAASERGIWLADWQKGLILMDAKDLAVLKTVNGNLKEPFKPSALACQGDYVWALDMAQLRFVKIGAGDPSPSPLPPATTASAGRQGERILESVKTPGPAPQGVGFDGYNLWAFDAATGLMYKYLLTPELGVEASFAVPGVKNILSMQWVEGNLWLIDSDGYLKRFKFTDNVFKKISVQKLKQKIVSFWVDAGVLRLLEKNQANAVEIKEYKIKIYN